MPRYPEIDECTEELFRSFKAVLEDFKFKYIEDNYKKRTNAENIVNLGRQEAINWVHSVMTALDRGVLIDSFK